MIKVLISASLIVLATSIASFVVGHFDLTTSLWDIVVVALTYGCVAITMVCYTIVVTKSMKKKGLFARIFNR